MNRITIKDLYVLCANINIPVQVITDDNDPESDRIFMDVLPLSENMNLKDIYDESIEHNDSLLIDRKIFWFSFEKDYLVIRV